LETFYVRIFGLADNRWPKLTCSVTRAKPSSLAKCHNIMIGSMTYVVL